MGQSLSGSQPASCIRMLDIPGQGEVFEVVLQGAKTKKIPRPKSAPQPQPKYEDIEQKLKAAEERRKEMCAAQKAALASAEKRAEEVRGRKASMGSNTTSPSHSQ